MNQWSWILFHLLSLPDIEPVHYQGLVTPTHISIQSLYVLTLAPLKIMEVVLWCCAATISKSVVFGIGLGTAPFQASVLSFLVWNHPKYNPLWNIWWNNMCYIVHSTVIFISTTKPYSSMGSIGQGSWFYLLCMVTTLLTLLGIVVCCCEISSWLALWCIWD